jgi:hypothetical protein
MQNISLTSFIKLGMIPPNEFFNDEVSLLEVATQLAQRK